MTKLRTNLMRGAAALMLAASLAACGFHLRGSDGQYNMPFQSVYLGFSETSPLGNELKRNLRAGGTVVIAPTAREAQAQFDVLSETRAKNIQSLNSQGRVREYLLIYTLVFRVRNAAGVEMLGPTEISLKRTIAFNEGQVLAKESEEALLYRDMQSDLVQQIMRRLAAIKPV